MRRAEMYESFLQVLTARMTPMELEERLNEWALLCVANGWPEPGDDGSPPFS
jgi:hypothetical protein